jgi:hypothetical protein
MKTLHVALISGSVGAFLAALIAVSLTTGLGTLLIAVAEGLRSEPIQESPAAIMQWYHQFDDEIERQAAAQETYYDYYVVWELTIDEIEPVGAYVQTTSKYPGSHDGHPLYEVSAFFTAQEDVARLRQDQQVAVHGKIVFINAGNIFLGDCRVRGSDEG